MQVARFKPSFEPRGETPHFFESGHIIAGRYRIRRSLGRGGMGSVYLAEDLVLGESGVAIKVLRRSGEDDPVAINRFLREVRLTRKIQHHNVVRTFDFGRDGDVIFYTMEYLSGQSLQSAITSGGLPYRTVGDMASQLMHGLAAIHTVGVVHHDVKPGNIIVGGDGTLKITDFGIARASAAPATMFASDVFGTLRYVAPEVLLGETSARAVDFYALGVVLFELLSGAAPLNEDNPARLILSKIEEQAPPIRALRPDIPAWLGEGVDCLLERDPDVRMKGVQKFAAALDAYVASVTGGNKHSLESRVSQFAGPSVASVTSKRVRAPVGEAWISILWAVLFSLFVLPITHTDVFSRIETGHADNLFQLRGPTAPHPGIAIVSLDEQSYQRLGVPLTAPWPRALHAKLLDALAQGGARRVVFDVIFADANPDNGEDRALAQAMKRVPTVLGAALGVSQRATINGAFLLEELLHPAEMFEAESVGVGVVGLPQHMGLVRQFPRATSDVFPNVSTLAEMAVALDRKDAKPPPAGARLNFYGPGRSISTIPYEFVISKEPGELPKALFDGKVVFVGLGLRSSTGASQRDAFVTPFDHQTFGAEIHATAASNLLQEDWIVQPSAAVCSAVTLGSAVMLSVLGILLTGLPLVMALAGALVAIIGLQFTLFVAGWFVPVVAGSVWGVFGGLLLRLVVAQSPTRNVRRRP